MKSVQDEKRCQLINAVQKEASRDEDMLNMYAVKALKSPNDKKTNEVASKYLCEYQAKQELMDKVVDLINRFWPYEEQTDD